MDLEAHRELIDEILPQGLRAPYYQLIGAAFCLIQALSGLLCDPSDAKLGKFARLDPHWNHAAPAMMIIGAFGAMLLGITYVLSRRRPLFAAVLAIPAYALIFGLATTASPESNRATIYILGNALMVVLLFVGAVVAWKEEDKIKRAIDRAGAGPIGPR